MHTMTLSPKYVTTIQQGFPLILREAVSGQLPTEEGQLFYLVDAQKHYLATAYYGKQNKGIGWVVTTDQQQTIDVAFFKQLLQRASARRQHLFNSTTTTAFRVFNGEGDGLGGLTIEYFDGYYVVNWYSAGIYRWRTMIYEALQQVVTIKALYEKKRFDDHGQYIDQDDFVFGEPANFPLVVKENNMHFAVDLNDGAMTGIFLDQRHVRQAIRDRYAKNTNMLNTFSYTGAFSVAAALGGAKQTTSVDVAKRSLPKTTEQFEVNAITAPQAIKVMDVFNYFKYAQKHGLTFDLVVLDPPSFARTKKTTFSSSKDYPKLLEDAIAITAKNGVIVASTNNAGITMKRFKQMVSQAFGQRKYRILETHQLPEDFYVDQRFPEFNYLKVLFIKKQF